ncbi:MAG: hypothetical protein WDW38_009555 [Sanguina aurantia]
MASRGGGRGGRGRGRGGPQQGMPGPQKDEDGTLLPPPDGPPPLFPEMDLPEHPQLTAKDRMLVVKRRELVFAGKSSLFFLDKPRDVGDGAKGSGGPEKYGERESKRPKKIKQPLSAVMTMSTDYFPAELMTTSDKRASTQAASKSQTAFWRSQAAKADVGGLKRLEQLQKAETAEAEGGGAEKKDDEEAPVEDEAVLDVDEEEDMENDDYYQGEQFDDDDGYDNDDGDGGGGDEGGVY